MGQSIEVAVATVAFLVAVALAVLAAAEVLLVLASRTNHHPRLQIVLFSNDDKRIEYRALTRGRALRQQVPATCSWGWRGQHYSCVDSCVEQNLRPISSR